MQIKGSKKALLIKKLAFPKFETMEKLSIKIEKNKQ